MAGRHVQIVTEHDAPKAEFLSQDISDPALGETRWMDVQTFIHDVRGHHAHEVGHGETFERNEVVEPKIVVRTIVDGKRVVRIGCDTPVPGKVLSHPVHSRLSHSREEFSGERGHDGGFVVKCAVANHRAHAAVEIEHRCKVEIHATRAQLDCCHPPRGARDPLPDLRVSIMEIPVLPSGGKGRESFSKSLHPTALVVDGNEQRRFPQFVDGITQPAQLLATAIVARKQDDASDAGMAQHVSLDIFELHARYTCHEGTEGHEPKRRSAIVAGSSGTVHAAEPWSDDSRISHHTTSRATTGANAATNRRPVSSTVHRTARSASLVTGSPANPHGSIELKGERSRSTLIEMP